MKSSFSMEAVDLDHQAPNRNKRESKYYWDELYSLISAGGFNDLEIPYEPKWDFGGRSGVPRTLRSVRVKFGSTHCYMEHLSSFGIDGISTVHLDPSLFCSGSMDMYFGALSHYTSEAIEFARGVGADTVTLSVTPPYHAVEGLLSTLPPTDGHETFLKMTAEVIENAARTAAAAGISLCLKNEYWGILRGEKILDFLKSLNCSVLLDVDTAHLQIAGINVPQFINDHKADIGVVHFTDTAFTDTEKIYRTALPEFPLGTATKVFRDIGDGMIDFAAIMEALKSTGYDGTIVYNCRNSYDVCRSILRTRYFIDHILNK